MGEPFLNKELPTIMTEEIYEVITKTRNFSIAISFDGADKETFESIRERIPAFKRTNRE